MPKQKDLDPPVSLNGYPAENLQVEEMQLEDLDQVMKIERLSFSSPWTRAYFQDEVARNPLSYVFVLRFRASRMVIGYVVCWVLQGQLHINNLAVAPEHRRRGYAELLIRYAFRLAKRAGSPKAVLEVRPSNSAAISLYQRLGFHVVGELSEYYSNGENALVLSVDIASIQ